MTTIIGKFMWKECRPDNREFRQNSSVLEPVDFPIGVPIPLTAEYVHNAEEILAAQLGSGNVDVPKPIYTNKAIQFALDYLGEYLRDPEPKDFQADTGDDLGVDDWGVTDTDNWSDDGKTETKSATTEDDGWSDAIDTDDKHKDDEKWKPERENWS